MTLPHASARRDWRGFAVFGGSPLFREPLHVNTPNAVDRRRFGERLDGVFDRRWYSDGVLVREFEAEIARLAGTRHCVATCNGTVALQVAARALGLAGEVIVPSFTYVATVQALRWLGITPVYADVDPDTHNLDPDAVRTLLSGRTAAVLGVHLWGYACDVEGLCEVADEAGVPLLFDAAHALGSTYRGGPVGGFGAAEVFSFHATKFVSTSEGGAVTTNDDDLAARLRAATDLGFDSRDRIVGPGTNGKMSEVCAAMGLTALERFDDLLGATRATAERYGEGLEAVGGIEVFEPPVPGRSNRQYVVTLVDGEAGVSRDEVLRVLRAEGILAKRYFHPGCHRLDPGGPGTPDRDGSGVASPARLPVTEALCERVLVLPGGAAVTPGDVDAVSGVLRVVLENGPEVAAALRRTAAG